VAREVAYRVVSQVPSAHPVMRDSTAVAAPLPTPTPVLLLLALAPTIDPPPNVVLSLFAWFVPLGARRAGKRAAA